VIISWLRKLAKEKDTEGASKKKPFRLDASFSVILLYGKNQPQPKEKEKSFAQYLSKISPV